LTNNVVERIAAPCILQSFSEFPALADRYLSGNVKTSSNVPNPLKWSIDAAAREFGVDSKTLKKNLVAAEQTPAPDGTYSTPQIKDALWTNSKRLRDEEVFERTKNMRLKNAFLEGNQLDRANLEAALEPVFLAITQIVTGSDLTAAEKKDILTNISGYPIQLSNVAQKQIKAKAYSPADQADGEE
jgi:hypothetical protein